MKRKCNTLRKHMQQGDFGDSLRDLPPDLDLHVLDCADCREEYTRLITLEDSIRNNVHVDHAAHTPAGLQWQIMQRLDSPELQTTRQSNRIFRFIPFRVWSPLAAALPAVVIAVIFLLPSHRDSLIPSESEITLIAESLSAADINDMYLSKITVYDYDEASLIAAMGIMASDPGVLANDLDEYIDSEPARTWIYSDEATEMFYDLTDNDWEEIRRFLS